MSFYTLCCIVYIVLNWIRNPEEYENGTNGSVPWPVLAVFFLVNKFRLIFSFRLISKVSKYSDFLVATYDS